MATKDGAASVIPYVIVHTSIIHLFKQSDPSAIFQWEPIVIIKIEIVNSIIPIHLLRNLHIILTFTEHHHEQKQSHFHDC